MTTYIFLDTNILDKQFALHPQIEELFRFKNLANEEIEIILLEIVVKELVDHARRLINKQNESVRALNSLRHWDSIDPIKEFEVERLIVKYEKQLSERFNVFTPNTDVYERVFSRYFKELKPFETKKQQFKDGLLWETIIDFKKQFSSEMDRYVLITSNSSDFAIDKQNKNSLHPHYKEEFPELILKNDVTSFLKEEGYYSEFEVDELIEECILDLLENYFTDHRWEFEEPLSDFLFEKNASSKKDIVLNGLNEKNIYLDYSNKPQRSNKYIHVPILVETTINLLVREHINPWELDEHEDYKLTVAPLKIECEAIFSEHKNHYSVVIMDKINITDKL